MMTTLWQRIAALAGLVFGLALLTILAAGGFYYSEVLNLRNDTAMRQLSQLQFQARKLKTNTNTRTDGEKVDLNRMLLPAGTSSSAAAQLQNRLIAKTSKAGGRIESAQVLDTQFDGDLAKIGVEVRMEIRTAALRNLLYDIESETPLSFVDNVIINRLGPSAAPADAADPALAVSLRVSNYMHRNQAKGVQ